MKPTLLLLLSGMAAFGATAAITPRSALAQKRITITEGDFAPEIDLSKQRPAEYVFSRHVEKKMSEIRAGKSNTTEADVQTVAAAE